MHNRSAGRITLIGLVMALTMMVVAVTGCAGQSEESVASDQGMESSSVGETDEGMMAGMTCPMCNDGAPAVEKGTATEENGVQVVNVTLKDGYYSPNEITIEAGMPAKLIFTGEAKDCAGKPMIAELNKKADFTQTGEATMDLGTLSAGTYELTCGMGSEGGSLIVQ